MMLHSKWSLWVTSHISRNIALVRLIIRNRKLTLLWPLPASHTSHWFPHTSPELEWLLPSQPAHCLHLHFSLSGILLQQGQQIHDPEILQESQESWVQTPRFWQPAVIAHESEQMIVWNWPCYSLLENQLVEGLKESEKWGWMWYCNKC